jgi:hypothetical protein
MSNTLYTAITPHILGPNTGFSNMPLSAIGGLASPGYRSGTDSGVGTFRGTASGFALQGPVGIAIGARGGALDGFMEIVMP